jgi:hypothetical protein
MTPKIFRSAVLALFAATQLPSFAATQAITCPTSIKPASIQVTVSESPDWTPYVGAALYLHAAAPMSGPPQMRGDLADFTTRPGKLEWSYTYKLEGTFDTGKWIQCAYGANNEMTLSKRISDDTQRCTITYRKGKKAAQHEIKIECD